MWWGKSISVLGKNPVCEMFPLPHGISQSTQSEQVVADEGMREGEQVGGRIEAAENLFFRPTRRGMPRRHWGFV